MKLAIFGDSYADINPDYTYMGWPNLLKQHSKNTYIKSLSGTSLWWSYQHFLRYIKNNKPDCIIFCYTNPYRWSALPEGMERSCWNIHNVKNSGFNSTLETLNQYYFDIFPMELSDFIAVQAFKEVNAYCEKNGIYLINVLCFNFKRLFTYPTRFPIFNDIDSVSRLERIHFRNGEYSMLEIFDNFDVPKVDPRICHLNDKNNRRFADILYNLLQNKPYNICVDAIPNFQWDKFDVAADMRFKEL